MPMRKGFVFIVSFVVIPVKTGIQDVLNALLRVNDTILYHDLNNLEY
jgi:hypothetical protein